MFSRVKLLISAMSVVCGRPPIATVLSVSTIRFVVHTETFFRTLSEWFLQRMSDGLCFEKFPVDYLV